VFGALAVACGDPSPETNTLESPLSNRVEFERVDINVALAQNGGVASSSGAHSSHPVWTVNDGRRGSPWEPSISWYAFWGSSTNSQSHCNPGNWWVQINFSGPREINEITLFSLQDNYQEGWDPTWLTSTSYWGSVDFHLQYCPSGVTCTSSGSGWVTPSGGHITGNDKAWRSVSFVPVLATSVRAVIDCSQGNRAYVVELEAWRRVTPTLGGPYGLAQTYMCNHQVGSFCYDPGLGPPLTTANEVAPYLDNAAKNWGCDWKLNQNAVTALAGGFYRWYGTQTNNASGCGIAYWNPQKQAAYYLPNVERGGNIARASWGARATASSTLSPNYGATYAIDGDRTSQYYGWGSPSGSAWHTATTVSPTNPQWLEIEFDTERTIQEIAVTTLRDDYTSSVEPTPSLTFSNYGIQDFKVSYWNPFWGGWSDIASVTNNNLVHRRFTFAPLTTRKIRIQITKAADGYAKLVEVEAYEAPIVSKKIYERYAALGGPAGSFGWPISNPTPYSYYQTTFEQFDHGLITFKAGEGSALAIGGAEIEDRALARRFAEHFNVTPYYSVAIRAPLGVANATDAGGATIGRYLQWYDGSAYEMLFARTGDWRAFYLDGLVRTAWRSYGAANGGGAHGAEPDIGAPWRAPLGLPITENIVYQQAIDAASYHQAFEQGAIVREQTSCDGAYTTSVKTLTNRPILEGYYGMLSCPAHATSNTYLTGRSALIPFDTGLKAGSFQFSAPDGGHGWFNGIDVRVANQTVVNVASAANGATVTTSSNYSSDFMGRGAIDGDRSGEGWGKNGVWQDGTQNSWGDWLQVTFDGSKSIHRIDVYSPQDNHLSPIQPTSTMTTTNYALAAFQVQYWTGSAWSDVPGGNVTGNTNVWRGFTFSPITTTSIRVLVNSAGGGWSRIAEVEAWASDDAIVTVKGKVFDAWLGGESSTYSISQALAGVNGTSGLGAPLSNMVCGDDNLCMQPFDQGMVNFNQVTGIPQVMHEGPPPCPDCPRVPYAMVAIPKGYKDCYLDHDPNVWKANDRCEGHKLELRWRNRPNQSGTTVKVVRIAKPLGAPNWSLSTQVGTFVLGNEEESVFTDFDAVGNARNCYNVRVENTHGGYYSSQFCAWTFDDRSFITADGNGNIIGGEVARRSVPSPIGRMEIGLEIPNQPYAGSKLPVWVSVGNSGPTYIRLPDHTAIDKGSNEFYPLTFTISDVSEVNDIKIAVAGSGDDDLKISAVRLKIDGVLAFEKSFATPLSLFYGNSGVGGYPVASTEDLRLNNPLWTNVYRYNFRGQPYNKRNPLPRNTGISGKGVGGSPGGEDFKRRIDGIIIDALLADATAQQDGSLLKSGTTLKAVGGNRLEVTQNLRAHSGEFWGLIGDLNCTLRYDLVIKAKDATDAYVPYDQNVDTGNGVGRIVKTEIAAEPKAGSSGSDWLSCSPTKLQERFFKFLVSFALVPILGPPLPTDWSPAGLAYFAGKYIIKDLALSEIKKRAAQYLTEHYSAKLMKIFPTGTNNHDAFPPGLHLCFPTPSGGYTPIMVEARDGGVSVCME
jgi:hypothetical protein